MDKLEDRQEKRDLGQEEPGDNQKSGSNSETVGGSAAAVDSQPSVKNKWNHDQELNFSGVRQQLSVLASALQKAIEIEKKRLAQTVGARNSYKK